MGMGFILMQKDLVPGFNIVMVTILTLLLLRLLKA
jgi:hypothetical protein